MGILLPNLVEERIYRREEVEGYIGENEGTSDYLLIRYNFPFDPVRRSVTLTGWRAEGIIDLKYRVFRLRDLEAQILERQALFLGRPEHRAKVDAIRSLLEQGQPVFPVFIYEIDPQQEIREGNHRAVALLELGSEFLPAFLPCYRE
jgi:PAS domain-containing protein